MPSRRQASVLFYSPVRIEIRSAPCFFASSFQTKMGLSSGAPPLRGCKRGQARRRGSREASAHCLRRPRCTSVSRECSRCCFHWARPPDSFSRHSTFDRLHGRGLRVGLSGFSRVNRFIELLGPLGGAIVFQECRRRTAQDLKNPSARVTPRLATAEESEGTEIGF